MHSKALWLSPVVVAGALVAACSGQDDGATGVDEETSADLAALTAPSCSNSGATLTNHEGFENYPFQSSQEHVYPGGAVLRTTAAARRGASALRAFVGRPQLSIAECTRRRYRAEVMVDNPQIPWNDGKSYWWGVSYDPIAFSDSAYSLLQLHAPNTPPGGCSRDGNTISLLPRMVDGRMSYALAVIERGGVSDGKGAGSNTKAVWSEPMKMNQWTDFVFNFTLSSTGKGYIHAWRNGQLVYSKTGLTNVNDRDACGVAIPPADQRSHGPHVGIYGPACSATGSHYREVLVDEVRTAVGRDGYGVVSPACH